VIQDYVVARSQGVLQGADPCEHRTVSKDGRIICRKIAEGDNEISPSLCLACPVAAINCAHLRFSLRQSCPSRLVVRFNGHTEIWGDEPPAVHLSQAACAERIIPIESPLRCASCALRQPVQAPSLRSGQAPTRLPALRPTPLPTPLPTPRSGQGSGQGSGQVPAEHAARPQPRRRIAHGGKVVPFRRTEPLAASA
jgi:hypothetical protein